MTDVESLKRLVEICTFDQYGTIVNMQTGLTEVAAPFLKKKGWPGDPDALVTWWRWTRFENSMIDGLPQPRDEGRVNFDGFGKAPLSGVNGSGICPKWKFR